MGHGLPWLVLPAMGTRHAVLYGVSSCVGDCEMTYRNAPSNPQFYRRETNG